MTRNARSSSAPSTRQHHHRKFLEAAWREDSLREFLPDISTHPRNYSLYFPPGTLLPPYAAAMRNPATVRLVKRNRTTRRQPKPPQTPRPRLPSCRGERGCKLGEDAAVSATVPKPIAPKPAVPKPAVPEADASPAFYCPRGHRHPALTPSPAPHVLGRSPCGSICRGNSRKDLSCNFTPATVTPAAPKPAKI